MSRVDCIMQVNEMTTKLVAMQYAASWLLMLIVLLQCASSAAVYHDYIIVGAGPSGLQLGYFLERAGRDYIILERSAQAGAWSTMSTVYIR